MEASDLDEGDIFTSKKGDPLIRLRSAGGKTCVLTFFHRDLFTVLGITNSWSLTQDVPACTLYVLCSGTSKKGPRTYIRVLNFHVDCNFNFEFDKYFRLI